MMHTNQRILAREYDLINAFLNHTMRKQDGQMLVYSRRSLSSSSTKYLLRMIHTYKLVLMLPIM
jgi:hypothetical protein